MSFILYTYTFSVHWEIISKSRTVALSNPHFRTVILVNTAYCRGKWLGNTKIIWFQSSVIQKLANTFIGKGWEITKRYEIKKRLD